MWELDIYLLFSASRGNGGGGKTVEGGGWRREGPGRSERRCEERRRDTQHTLHTRDTRDTPVQRIKLSSFLAQCEADDANEDKTKANANAFEANAFKSHWRRGGHVVSNGCECLVACGGGSVVCVSIKCLHSQLAHLLHTLDEHEEEPASGGGQERQRQESGQEKKRQVMRQERRVERRQESFSPPAGQHTKRERERERDRDRERERHTENILV